MKKYKKTPQAALASKKEENTRHKTRSNEQAGSSTHATTAGETPHLRFSNVDNTYLGSTLEHSGGQ